MRASLAVTAAAVALLVLAPAARAENFNFGLATGISIPTGDYGDAVGPGPMFGVTGDLDLNPSVALGADIIGNFHGMSSDLEDAFTAAGINGFDFSFTVIQFGGHLKWTPAPGGPWLKGGLGLYQGSTRVEYLGIEDTNSEGKVGFNIGAGYEFPLRSAMNLGIHASLHNVSDALEEFDVTTGQPTGNTKSAQYVSIGLGLTFLTAPRP
jgi:hypothetical protein